MYPEEICKPMREDLTSVGFVEMKDHDEVANVLDKKEGTVLVMVN
jgi:putative YphP/YqiW family bacilliredoxin